MENETKKGIIFGFIGVIFVGLQPVVAISKPSMVNAYISAAMTCLVETAIFFPLMLIELKRSKKNVHDTDISNHSISQRLKNNLWLLIFIGFIFGVNQIFFFCRI